MGCLDTRFTITAKRGGWLKSSDSSNPPFQHGYCSFMMQKLLLVCFLALMVGCSAAPAASPPPAASPTETLVYEQKVPFGVIQVLDSPQTVTANQAAGHITSNDLVMGMEINGESRAYPIGLMRRYEIANDTLGGEAIAVTFCPSCNTGLSFSRVVDGEPLVFDFSGKILDGAMVMRDRQSQSMWSQVRLQAVEGAKAGTRLELLASNQMTWQEWASQYPDTTLVIDPRAPMKETSLIPVVPTGPLADPEAYHGYVAGIAWEGAAMAFPLDSVTTQGVVNSEIAGLPILLVAGNEPGAVTVWERTVEGQVLTFTLQDGKLIDSESQSIWNAQTGIAESGTLAGSQLTAADAWICDWRGWLDAYPGTSLEL